MPAASTPTSDLACAAACRVASERDDGRPAATRYRVLAATAAHGLVLARPLTGRTHQIRIHLASSGVPLLGDRTYLPADVSVAACAPRMLLHAWRLECAYPGTGAPF